MKPKILVIILLLLLIPVCSVAGTAYYVDPSAAAGGNGSFAKPWNTVAQINAFHFKTGDDLYFKAGSRTVINGRLTIQWSGTENDRVIIGAYYGNNLFGLGGRARPVLDGNGKWPNSDHTALVDAWNQNGYVTITDINIKNTYGGGIRFGNVYTKEGTFSTNNVVTNCYLENIGRYSILLARSSHGLIENTTINGSNLRCIVNLAGNCVNDGAAIEITGMGNESVTRHNVVRGCVVTGSHETIGLYKSARYTTIENNTLFGFGRVGVYMANSRNHIVRNNIIYEPANSLNGRRTLIWIDNETHIKNGPYPRIGGHEIYGNYLAGGIIGIRMGCQSNKLNIYNSDNKIYDNVIVDCDYNFRFYNNVAGWENNSIRDNYSFIFTRGLHHANNYSPHGVEWKNNYFNTQVSGNAYKTANLTRVSLASDVNWRSLIAGEVNKTFFSFFEKDGLSPKALQPVSGISVKLIN